MLSPPVYLIFLVLGVRGRTYNFALECERQRTEYQFRELERLCEGVKDPLDSFLV